jgi:hypothetical protein
MTCTVADFTIWLSAVALGVPENGIHFVMAIIWLVRRAPGSPLLSKTIGRRLGTVRGGLETGTATSPVPQSIKGKEILHLRTNYLTFGKSSCPTYPHNLILSAHGP